MEVDVVQQNQFVIPENGATYTPLALLNNHPEITFTRIGTNVKMTISVNFTSPLVGSAGETPIPDELIGCNVVNFDVNTLATGTILVETGLSSDMAKMRITTDNIIINAAKGKLGSSLSLIEGDAQSTDSIA